MPTSLAVAALLAAAPSALAQAPDRPFGAAFTWGYELNQDELPSYDPDRAAPPFPPARWYRIIDGILGASGRNGLWYTGPSALPFPPLPLAPNEPVGWRTPRNLAAQYARTGLSWDVAHEVWAARKALRAPGVTVLDPTVSRFAYTQRVSLVDPAYRRAALAEIRRIAPTVRGKPYVFAWTGSDEPLIRLPRGRAAERSRYARTMRAQVRGRYGQAAPRATARRTAAPAEGLRWLAYNRWAADRFFAMKAEQAALIRRLAPGARVLPNDYGFIRGFVPWDYTRLSAFADLVEADPYVSFAEAVRPGRGRYNPGFGAKFMSDLTGVRTRVVLQAFTYSGYTPEVADLYAWAGQALRAGATDITLFASGNPRFTDRPFYEGMQALARDLRGTRLPAPPTDPATLVLYATASEGQGQPSLTGDDRYLASGDALYSLYGLLGELGHAAFSFDADARLEREPARLAAARTVWLPRADTLDQTFARRLADWVRAGGTLIVGDPAAFTRTPDGGSLADVRAELIGAGLGPARPGRLVRMGPGALAAGLPADELYAAVEAPSARAFDAVPEGRRWWPGSRTARRRRSAAPWAAAAWWPSRWT
ncbi:MAG: hypothetical protein U0237_04285 [Thermoleophilia bacterium]